GHRADQLGRVEGPAGRRRHPRGPSEHQGLELRVRARDGAGRVRGVQAAGKPFNAVLTLRTDDVGMGCAYRKLHNPNLKVWYETSGNSQIRVALTALMMKLKGAKIPPKIVFPIQLQNEAKRTECVKGYPTEASATSLVPLSLIKRMYPYNKEPLRASSRTCRLPGPSLPSCCRSAACRRRSGPCKRFETSPSTAAAARSTRWSGRTGPGSRHCSGWPAGSSPPTTARSRSTGGRGGAARPARRGGSA